MYSWRRGSQLLRVHPVGEPSSRHCSDIPMDSSNGSTWDNPLHLCAHQCDTFPWKSTCVLLSLVPEHWKKISLLDVPSVRLICAFERSASSLSSWARHSAQAVHKGKCFKEIIHSAFLGWLLSCLPGVLRGRGTSGNSLSPRQLNESWRRLRLPAHNYVFVTWLSSLKVCWRLDCGKPTE